MNWPWPSLTLADYAALATMLGGALWTIFKFIQKIRTNDLRHLDEKIDTHHEAIMAALERAEEKIDRHVRDHAVGVFK